MKTTIKKIAAGTIFALILFVVNAKAEGTEILASNLETTETTLQMESWMIDETIWNTISLNVDEFVQETENSMELESWMTSEELWNTKDNDAEAELMIENWMIDSDFWK